MTREEAVALLERYSNYDGMGIPNLAGCKEAMKVAVESLKEAFPELAESEDERTRKVIYKLMLGMREEIFTSQDEIVTKEKVLAYLEKLKGLDKMIVVSPEVWDNAISDAFKNGKKEGEKQKEQKQEWSEEDEMIYQHCKTILHDYGYDDWLENRLKFFRPRQDRCKDCPHRGDMFLLTQGIKSGKHELASEFMNYLDENRPYGKMGLSNEECEDIDKAFNENDWAKILKYVKKYRPSWKPSEEQMEALRKAVNKLAKSDVADSVRLSIMYDNLKKLM